MTTQVQQVNLTTTKEIGRNITSAFTLGWEVTSGRPPLIFLVYRRINQLRFTCKLIPII